MERLIRGTDNIADRLGISVRTQKGRLESRWKEGYGFFKDECGYWCIRETNLDKLITAMEHGWLPPKGAHVKDTEQ